MVVPVNVDSVLEQDAINGFGGNRFGIKNPMELTIEDGTFHDFGNYSVWRMPVYSQNAKSLNFLFTNLNLPEGSQMFIYGMDNKMIHGPIEAKNVHDGVYSSDIITGELVTIEVFLLTSVKEEFSIEIPKVVHGIDLVEIEERGIGTSAPCNVNTICPQGAGFENEIDAVCQTYINNEAHCTGTLINTECSSLDPFILTANHCISGEGESNFAQWGFKFNFESTSCANNLLGTTVWFSGAEFRASFEDTDFALLEMLDPISSEPDLGYAGWDRSGSLGTNTTFIHHPVRDLKKISFDAGAPVIETEDRSFGIPGSSNEFTIPGGNMLRINFSGTAGGDFGILQGGSSGSAYFNQDNRIVAQHIGGPIVTCTSGGDKLGGRFSISWDGGGTDDTRLSNWLGGVNNPMTTNTVIAPHISGEDFLCHSDGAMDYVLNNPLANHLVSWEVSPASLFSSNTNGTSTTATLEAASSVAQGEAILTFTLSNLEAAECGSQTITKNIWVGKPTTPVIQALPCFSPGTNIAFIVHADGADTYDWTFPQCPNGPSSSGDPDPECWFNYNSNSPSNTTILVYVGEQGGTISVSATNRCGTTFSNLLPIEFCDIQTPGDGPIIRSNSEEDIEEEVHLKDLSGNDSKIHVYPNPTEDIWNISLDDDFYVTNQSKNIQVLSMTGYLAYQVDIVENKHSIDASNLPKGIYYLKVQYENDLSFQKIIIQ